MRRAHFAYLDAKVSLHDVLELGSIPRAGTPALTRGVIPYAEPFHELGATSRNVIESWVNAGILERFRRSICLEMLHLSPDTRAHILE